MATETYGIQGQAVPSGSVLTDFVTVPALTQAVISSILVCNQVGSDTTYSLSVAKAGATDDPKQYIASGAPLKANETFGFTLGITLGPGDIVRCLSGNGRVSFNAFGSVITP